MPGGTVISRHEGLDFRAPAGTPVLASASGTVFWRGKSRCGGGRIVTFLHEPVPHPETGKLARLYVIYNHVTPKVWNFEKFEAGDVIAEVEADNDYDQCSDFPHVHLETRHGGRGRPDTVSPHYFWVEGVGIVTCWRDGMTVPPGRIVAPLACD
jgi:murein DD-endopeptidase MepM/ murein hydrolase activator NlpD